ncbi:polymyxin B resistance protein pmrD (plasmid) [Klebsiella aerogenes]|uniref:polymyxin B resistance protein pmrD n=1 Tax=Klebsiella aerogenes TaxID=548 RepID=UPI002A82E4D6|nr:polymyxin B resistance protein pmrD [Klebsiella aerogenes]WPS11064.1 polymyxin B resistance protein pmrD [Klebsiella aerogenes]
MEWLVIDAFYLRATESYMLVLRSGSLKMMVEAISKTPVLPGDILHPVRDAIYLINKNESRPVKAINASEFSATRWRFLKKSSKRKSLAT